MTKQEIQNKYWIEFLIWYKSANIDKVCHWDGSSHVIYPIDDIFWNWLIRERAKDSGTDFIEKLREEL